MIVMLCINVGRSERDGRRCWVVECRYDPPDIKRPIDISPLRRRGAGHKFTVDDLIALIRKQNPEADEHVPTEPPLVIRAVDTDLRLVAEEALA